MNSSAHLWLKAMLAKELVFRNLSLAIPAATAENIAKDSGVYP
jgi:hypothetical protein